MSEGQKYPKRLIEVDLPIRKISEHARNEKAIRQGHLASLHLWWARRPLGACRAVILASLLPDPADSVCPSSFRTQAAVALNAFRDRRGGAKRDLTKPLELRSALLAFVADFANWDVANESDYVALSHKLVQAAREVVFPESDRPLVFDPFAGGGAIPVEALRVGADAYASDLNPIAVLLNKVVEEYVPKFKERLPEELERWGARVREKVEAKVGQFYPRDPDGALPIAYLWARTIRCEGPGCGVELPLVRSLTLAKKAAVASALRMKPNRNQTRIDFELLNGEGAKSAERLTPKDEEAIWNPGRVHSATGKKKDEAFYEAQMGRALAEARRIVRRDGIGVVVFAHKSTAGWEAILGALIDAGWVVTASWPIDTENATRMNAMGTASLASSVHIVCRPRENADGGVSDDQVGDWSSVLAALQVRIRDWLPRLSAEGVVGADAIFACLGPALEEFSRFSRVERASGERVLLREYLEQVWAVVSREALSSLFRDADVAGLEPDARLTSMWLWTLKGPVTEETDAAEASDDADEDDDEEKGSGGVQAKAGFSLEFDAARKIAQGLGARLDELVHVVDLMRARCDLRTGARSVGMCCRLMRRSCIGPRPSTCSPSCSSASGWGWRAASESGTSRSKRTSSPNIAEVDGLRPEVKSGSDARCRVERPQCDKRRG